MSTDWLAELRTLEQAATPGRWEVLRQDDGTLYGQPATYDIIVPVPGEWRSEPVVCGGFVEDGGPSLGAAELPDAQLIVAMRNALPAILDALSEPSELAVQGAT